MACSTGASATRKPGGSGERRLAGEGEHGAVRVDQVELRVGLEQHQVAQEAGEVLGMPLVHLEQVVVHGHDTAEEGIRAVVGRLVLEALEGVQHGRGDAERGEGAGDEDRQRDLEADRHRGASRIL
jgi:hypothetical protein